MRKFNYLLGITMLGIFASCGGGSKGGSNSVTLIVEPELGELSDFISISDTEVNVKLIDDKEDGNDVKSIVSSIAINVKKGVASDYSFGLDVAVLDENHIEISSLPNYSIDSKWDTENSPYTQILYAGNTRAQMNETQDAEDWDEEAQQIWDKIRTQGKYIVVKPAWSSAKFVPYNSASSNYSSSSESSDDEIEIASVDTEDEIETSSSTSDEDFDEFLAAYEKYIDKYIALMKKAKDGDYSAMADAASLMSDAPEYGEKLQKMSGNLTPSQLAKFQKLQQKLLSAAQ